MPTDQDHSPNSLVLAVVVTFNPDDELTAHLQALRQETDVIVVDNGSSDPATVEAAAQATGCRLILNKHNRGIATALNQAAAIADAEGYMWLATFDQDSLIPRCAIGSVLSSYANHPTRDRIAIIAMSCRDRATGRDYTAPWSILDENGQWRSLRTVITSGSLAKISALKAVGFFDDGLFIDAVDHDICLRCRSQGHLIIQDKTVVMDHSTGAATSHTLFGRVFAVTHHSATRQYYITRNLLEVASRALSVDREWARRGFTHLLIGIGKVVVFEDQKGAKLLAIAAGAWDFVFRRFGPKPARP